MKRAFTLIELLIAVALGLALTALAATSFFQVRTMVQRRDALLAMHRNASAINLQMDQRLTAVAQHAAMVVDARPADRNGLTGRATLRLLYLRGKQQANDWGRNISSSNDQWLTENTDLLWDLWEYRPEEQTLYVGTTSRSRGFTAGPGVPTMNGQPFAIIPQPRRTLAGPSWWVDLDDNRIFPNATTPSVSDASPSDTGDWSHLQEQLRPCLKGVTEMTISVETYAGGTPVQCSAACDPVAGTVASSTTGGSSPLIMPGLHIDGSAPDAAGRNPGISGWTWSTTVPGARPRLLRLRWTSRDSTTGISQVFSFSFALPGLVGPG